MDRGAMEGIAFAYRAQCTANLYRTKTRLCKCILRSYMIAHRPVCMDSMLATAPE